MHLRLILLLVCSLVPWVAQAQTPPEGTEVSIIVENKALDGTYYDPGGDAPAVLLLHQLYTERSSWSVLAPQLLAAGYKVLVVDLRGYGTTRGKINWKLAQQDTRSWSKWLTEQPHVSGILMIGSSMGANLALVGCAEVEACQGAVALSPSLNYFGVHTEAALETGKAALMVYAENDPYPADDAGQMQEIGGAALTVWQYAGRAHGMDLFGVDADLPAKLINWLGGR